ncbi:hypothetical protein Tco_1176892 [Tanacetum coccineum]
MKQMKQAVAGEGSSVAHDKYYEFKNTLATNSDATRGSSCSDTDEEKDVETDDSDDSGMDLSDDNPQGDDDASGFGVFMYNKYTEPLKSTYLSLTVTCSSLEYIQSLLNETHVHELMDLMSNLVYTDAHITSVEMFPDEAAHHNSSPLANTTSYLTTNPQHNSLQAKAKRLMQKAKKNMWKINFKKAVAQKFKEYDQKLEALTSINVSKVIKKAAQAKFLTEMKKLLPTHVLKAVANYVKPRLNNSVREVMQNNQISLVTKSSTLVDDLSEIDLKLKLLNKIHSNKSNKAHTTHQKLYDTHIESIYIEQTTINAQDAEPSFHKRTHDNQDPPNYREGENRKKRKKDAGEPSSRSSRKDKSYVKSGSANAKRRTTLFDLLLKSDVDQNEDHILRPSTVAMAKKLKEFIF